MTRPNILYLHSHDTGRYVEPYGHAVPTPSLRHLAEEGVLFRQAFCANPTCSPSRAALLTGQWPHCNGMLGLAHRGFRLQDYSRHLAQVLQKAGYATALAGVQHEAHEPHAPLALLGYQELLNHEGPWGDLNRTVEVACAYMSRARRPFFLSVGFIETHRNFPPLAPQCDSRYALPPTPLPDTPETRLDIAAFKTSARILDEKMGAVLAALAAAGLSEQTIVICTTDHGIAFPAMKCNLTDHGLGVMLIIRGPGGFTGGKVVEGLASHIDIFPTLCEIAQIPAPPWLQGCSLVPLVDGRATQIHDAIFAEVNFHAAYEPMRCVRTTRWKYIRRFDSAPPPARRPLRGQEECGWKLPPGPVLPNCDAGPSKTFWFNQGWQDQHRPAEALYDLVFDPCEACNLGGSAAHAGILQEMRLRLEGWMRETDDPLLRGPLPIPPGAKINDPCSIDPGEEVFTV